MAVTKVSAFPAATTISSTDEIGLNQSGTSRKGTITQVRGYLGTPSAIQVTGYAADTYLAGSGVTIPTAGGWKVGTIYRCQWDMTKTAAGTAGIVVTLRMGTLGTTADASIMTFTFGAGTAAADQGTFTLFSAFRAVGSGTSAAIQAVLTLTHGLAATGLTSNGAAGAFTLPVISAGFNSTTQTIIGLSFNGGASFSGTSTVVIPELQGI